MSSQLRCPYLTSGAWVQLQTLHPDSSQHRQLEAAVMAQVTSFLSLASHTWLVFRLRASAQPCPSHHIWSEPVDGNVLSPCLSNKFKKRKKSWSLGIQAWSTIYNQYHYFLRTTGYCWRLWNSSKVTRIKTRFKATGLTTVCRAERKEDHLENYHKTLSIGQKGREIKTKKLF